MKLVMTLLVRDEADVIEQNLEHHLAQGVDAFIVTDNGSLDDTLPILRRYEQRGLLELIEEPAQTYAQAVWVTRMAERAAAINADWNPASGKLSKFRSCEQQLSKLLANLDKLRRQGVIDDDEFALAKTKVLNEP